MLHLLLLLLFMLLLIPETWFKSGQEQLRY